MDTIHQNAKGAFKCASHYGPLADSQLRMYSPVILAAKTGHQILSSANLQMPALQNNTYMHEYLLDNAKVK